MKNSNRENRSRQRGQMHQAVCDQCGQKCEVPFRPTGDKPIYCNTCFEQRQGGQSRRSDGRDFRRSRSRDKKMYDAVCDQCGQKCQVSFQPTSGKPIFCDQCFKEKRGPGKSDQLALVNQKLDKIIEALIAAKIIKPETKKPAVKKPTAAKTKKKPAAKKASAAKTKKKTATNKTTAAKTKKKSAAKKTPVKTKKK